MSFFRHIFIYIMCACITLHAQAHTEKTFLLPQPVRVPTQSMFYDYVTHLMEKEHTLGWDHFQVTGFYRQQNNGVDVGTYFGRNHRNVVKIASAATDITAFDPSNLIFTNNPLALTLAGSFKLKPYRRARACISIISSGYRFFPKKSF